jgi:hypothetical protein
VARIEWPWRARAAGQLFFFLSGEEGPTTYVEIWKETSGTMKGSDCHPLSFVAISQTTQSQHFLHDNEVIRWDDDVGRRDGGPRHDSALNSSQNEEMIFQVKLTDDNSAADVVAWQLHSFSFKKNAFGYFSVRFKSKSP